MYEQYLQRIQSIADFLSKSPFADQAVDFLSGNLSPRDEIAVVYRGTVDSDGLIRCENLCGFSKQEHMSQAIIKLSDDRPLSCATRTQKIIWTTESTVAKDYADFVHFDAITPWSSMVSIPVGLSRIYCCAFPSDLTNLVGINVYVDALQSLLRVYESSLEIRTLSAARDLAQGSDLQPLTQRQEKILALLRAGKTNKSISQTIGYSESLVRHETMIIYKKLRVDGRHQLRESTDNLS